MKRAIIGIDPGASGGISTLANNKIQAVKMPENVQQMNEYLSHIKTTYERPLVFIEKVQAFVADDAFPGKKFGINKMLANYEQLLTVLKLSGIEYVQVAPISWQSALGFKVKSNKGLTKTQRKILYRDRAQATYPEIKVNLQVADSLCLVIFGMLKIKNDPDWVIEKIENRDIKKVNLLY
jgi:hypothetical protein